jgi:undecaprenyl-diphosphatase
MHRAFLHLLQLDAEALRLANRINLRPLLARFFAIISRLGDGVFWYLLMAVLPLVYGREGMEATLLMTAAGVPCALLYGVLKRTARRARPFRTLESIHTTVPPLDEYSFPSGHTMHAFAFTWAALHGFPGLAVLLVPFALLVALSRMVLGLHYLSDVLVGALLGTLVATTAISVLA